MQAKSIIILAFAAMLTGALVGSFLNQAPEPWLIVYVDDDEFAPQKWNVSVCGHRQSMSSPVISIAEECEGTVFLSERNNQYRSEETYITPSMNTHISYSITASQIASKTVYWD